MNIFSPLEGRYFNKKSIANKEDKNVEIRPTIKGRKLKILTLRPLLDY